jgi:hypothetical protein
MRVEGRVVVGDTQHGHKVAACGRPPRSETIGVEAEFFGIEPQEAHCGFAVFYGCGKNGLAAESIFYRSDCVSSSEHAFAAIDPIFGAAFPSAAMYPDN